MGRGIGVGRRCRALLDVIFSGFATEGRKAYYRCAAVVRTA